MFGPLLGNAAIIGSARILESHRARKAADDAMQHARSSASAFAQYQSQLSNMGQASAAAQLAALGGIANANVVPIREPEPSSLRTAEEIQAQLEARLAEMEAEARKAERMMPCANCKWGSAVWCHNPFVEGLPKQTRYNYDAERMAAHTDSALCGPEKALWEPKQPWYLKLWNWFLAPWQ